MKTLLSIENHFQISLVEHCDLLFSKVNISKNFEFSKQQIYEY